MTNQITMTPQEETIKQIATRIAENMDGRTVTSHEHYRDMLAKEIEFELNKVIEQVEKWGKSNAGATGVDMRGRRWVDLQDLLSFLTTLKK